MAQQLKSWDAYVAEARREPLILPVADDEEMTIEQPTYGQIKAANEAVRLGDVFGQLTALVGETNAMRLEFLFDTAPHGAIVALLRDITDKFGLLAPGERSASPS